MKKVLVIALLSLPLSACYTTDPALTGAVVRRRRDRRGERRPGGRRGRRHDRRRHRRSGLSSPDGAVRVRPVFRPGGLLSVLSRCASTASRPAGTRASGKEGGDDEQGHGAATGARAGSPRPRGAQGREARRPRAEGSRRHQRYRGPAGLAAAEAVPRPEVGRRRHALLAFGAKQRDPRVSPQRRRLSASAMSLSIARAIGCR